MLKRDALRHFGTPRLLAEALGISVQAVDQWGRLVPETSAYKLHVLTSGVLHANPTAYLKRRARPEPRAGA